jgi:hypothetical protein
VRAAEYRWTTALQYNTTGQARNTNTPVRAAEYRWTTARYRIEQANYVPGPTLTQLSSNEVPLSQTT